jgi:molybdate transport system substrate-binding protein
VFVELARVFESTHASARVALQCAGTQELRAQLEHGARADVFASADPLHADALARAGLLDPPLPFARGGLAIVVAREARARIASLSALAEADRIVVGARESPIGRYTEALLARADSRLGGGFRARVEARVVSREPSVKQVLAKVRLGEADAGVVYASDLVGLDDVGVVAVPAELDVAVTYPIARVARAAHPELAAAFIDLARSEQAHSTLAARGLAPAP